MDALLAALIAFPTVIFSTLMVAAVLYWLMVILGALDIDLFSSGDDAGHDSMAGHNPHVVLELLHIGKVPITIILSTFVFAAWATCFLGSALLEPLLSGWPGWLFSPVLLTAAVFVGAVSVNLGLRPLAHLFTVRGNASARDLVGRPVIVTSSTVDERFGTARYDAPSGEDVLLNVIADSAHRLVNGEQAVVLDYDRALGVYRIAPLPHTRPGFLSEAEPNSPDRDMSPTMPHPPAAQ